MIIEVNTYVQLRPGQVKFCNQSGHQSSAQSRRYRERNSAIRLLILAAHDIGGMLDCRVNPAGMLVKRSAGLGQTDAAGCAIEEDHAEVLFQPSYFLANRRAAGADLPGSFGETQCCRHFLEDIDIRDIHSKLPQGHRSSLETQENI